MAARAPPASQVARDFSQIEDRVHFVLNELDQRCMIVAGRLKLAFFPSGGGGHDPWAKTNSRLYYYDKAGIHPELHLLPIGNLVSELNFILQWHLIRCQEAQGGIPLPGDPVEPCLQSIKAFQELYSKLMCLPTPHEIFDLLPDAVLDQIQSLDDILGMEKTFGIEGVNNVGLSPPKHLATHSRDELTVAFDAPKEEPPAPSWPRAPIPALPIPLASIVGKKAASYNTVLFWDVESLLPTEKETFNGTTREVVSFFTSITAKLEERGFVHARSKVQGTAFVTPATVTSEPQMVDRLQQLQFTTITKTNVLKEMIKAMERVIEEKVRQQEPFKIVLLTSGDGGDFANALNFAAVRRVPVCVVSGADEASEEDDLMHFWAHGNIIPAAECVGPDGFQTQLHHVAAASKGWRDESGGGNKKGGGHHQHQHQYQQMASPVDVETLEHHFNRQRTASSRDHSTDDLLLNISNDITGITAGGGGGGGGGNQEGDNWERGSFAPDSDDEVLDPSSATTMPTAQSKVPSAPPSAAGGSTTSAPNTNNSISSSMSKAKSLLSKLPQLHGTELIIVQLRTRQLQFTADRNDRLVPGKDYVLVPTDLGKEHDVGLVISTESGGGVKVKIPLKKGSGPGGQWLRADTSDVSVNKMRTWSQERPPVLRNIDRRATLEEYRQFTRLKDEDATILRKLQEPGIITKLCTGGKDVPQVISASLDLDQRRLNLVALTEAEIQPTVFMREVQNKLKLQHAGFLYADRTFVFVLRREYGWESHPQVYVYDPSKPDPRFPAYTHVEDLLELGEGGATAVAQSTPTKAPKTSSLSTPKTEPRVEEHSHVAPLMRSPQKVEELPPFKKAGPQVVVGRSQKELKGTEIVLVQLRTRQLQFTADRNDRLVPGKDYVVVPSDQGKGTDFGLVIASESGGGCLVKGVRGGNTADVTVDRKKTWTQVKSISIDHVTSRATLAEYQKWVKLQRDDADVFRKLTKKGALTGACTEQGDIPKVVSVSWDYDKKRVNIIALTNEDSSIINGIFSKELCGLVGLDRYTFIFVLRREHGCRNIPALYDPTQPDPRFPEFGSDDGSLPTVNVGAGENSPRLDEKRVDIKAVTPVGPDGGKIETLTQHDTVTQRDCAALEAIIHAAGVRGLSMDKVATELKQLDAKRYAEKKFCTDVVHTVGTEVSNLQRSGFMIQFKPGVTFESAKEAHRMEDAAMILNVLAAPQFGGLPVHHEDLWRVLPIWLILKYESNTARKGLINLAIETTEGTVTRQSPGQFIKLSSAYLKQVEAPSAAPTTGGGGGSAFAKKVSDTPPKKMQSLGGMLPPPQTATTPNSNFDIVNLKPKDLASALSQWRSAAKVLYQVVCEEGAVRRAQCPAEALELGETDGALEINNEFWNVLRKRGDNMPTQARDRQRLVAVAREVYPRLTCTSCKRLASAGGGRGVFLCIRYDDTPVASDEEWEEEEEWDEEEEEESNNSSSEDEEEEDDEDDTVVYSHA